MRLPHRRSAVNTSLKAAVALLAATSSSFSLASLGSSDIGSSAFASAHARPLSTTSAVATATATNQSVPWSGTWRVADGHVVDDLLRAHSLYAQLPTTSAALVTIPGSSLSLVPPPGFALSADYSGFFHERSNSSIVLTELPPEAYQPLADTFSGTPEEITATFASRGLAIEVSSVSRVSHVPASHVPESHAPASQIGSLRETPLQQKPDVLLISGTQMVGGLQVQKYMALWGEENTLLLTFNVMPGSPLTEQAVIETIRSAQVMAAPSVADSVAALPFSFRVAAPFQVDQVLMGSTVLLSASDGNSDGNSARIEPAIIIASSVNALVSDLRGPEAIAAFASQMLRNTNGFAEVELRQQGPVTFAGENGYWIEAALPSEPAETETAATETAAVEATELVHQYVALLPNGHSLRMIVLGTAEELETLAPAIQSIQRSVAAKPQ